VFQNIISVFYISLDAYAAAWRDAIVKELRAYKATSDHLFSEVLGRCFDEARFLRLNGGKAAICVLPYAMRTVLSLLIRL
jgi:hypothetical protein